MDNLIQNFSIKSVTDFFKAKIYSFSPKSENLDYLIDDIQFESFEDLQKIGEVEFNNSDELIVFTCKFQGVLSERSSKKRQFEIAKKVLKEDFKDGAIFIFYDDNDCFRFSFIRKNYGNKDQKFTNWKRYTYFVDPSRTNKTFKNRINGCNFSSLEDIQEAFSVEKLNKKFYEEIATAFYSLIGGKVSINKKEVSFDAKLQLPSTPVENRKVYQEFAVRLIGRTIFCWFLKNKKSDSGVPLIPEEWLSSNMVASVNNDQHNYYHSILEKLFFLVLNKKHEDRKPYVLPNNHEFVPFLNGGLFEAQDDDFFPKDSKGIHSQNFALNIPNQWFSHFFETLEQYNFTIDENSINDFEVSIDPEMLGTIFENLLAEIDPDTEKSARKSTGSFYTPREIVDYMVEQSLLQYIKTKTNIEDEEQLEVLLKDDTENPFNEKQTIAILSALSEVKILDPACGSGAFPMGVLHKIIALLKKLDKGAVWWKAKQLEKIDNALVRKAMETKLNQANSDYIRKLGVIQHSIYGVDIQPIAAEISKLRSFLSLIIDENIDDNHPDGNRGIEPLPNLEFKFVTANTLISLDEGNTVGKSMSFDFGETSDLQNQLQKIRSAYLQATPTDKQKLKTDFEKLQTQIYKNELKAGGQNKRAQQLAAWKPFSNESSTWFDPDWMFGVEKFDVVIGNPPYIGEKGNKNKFQEIKKSNLKDFYLRKMDFFYFFFHQGLNVSNNNGLISFITTNYFISATGATKLRADLKERSSIYKIINFGQSKVFQSAMGQHNMITFLSKTKKITNCEITSVTSKKLILGKEFEQIFKSEHKETSHSKIAIENLFDGSQNYIRISTSGNKETDTIKNNIFAKIQSKGVILGKLCDVNQGLRTGADKVSKKHISEYGMKNNYSVGDGIFFLKNSEIDLLKLNSFEKSKIKELYKNSDISKYLASEITDLSMIDIFYPNDKDLDKLKIPNLINHLKKFKEILEGRKENANGLDKAIAKGEYFYGAVRRKLDFTLPKIISPQRSKTNTFAYTEKDWYASADVYFITDKSKKIDLKYILGILNSKLYFFWLKNKGKCKGEMLELYQKPLSEIPIYINEDFYQIILLVDQILSNKKQNLDTTELETKIDLMVYKLYELTYDEVLVVEPEFSLSEQAYDNYIIEA